MGVRYSASDSAQLIQAMTSNLQVANQVTDRLSSGCDHLIASLDSGELQGAAYTAEKGLFTDIIIPCIKKLQAAIDDIQGELNSYKYADSTVAEYGTLDLDLLKEELKTRQEQLAKVEEQIAANRDFMFKFGAFVSLMGKFSEQNALRELENQLNISIWEIQEKLTN
ncbi:T7SS effector LXG polymorphic toxin [Streptococcus sinensis]|uniref:T7SS effector LXG polymorphic toxin n=1 Tax=Streptococcus sinensis TaxID=176090 RepID=UPI002729A908|nr:T7SS effector LXG polymorphic toxin [Streptococcus sinensis]